jgi:hypothetical protein
VANVGPLVDYPENPHGPLLARTVIPLSAEWADEAEHEVLLGFEAERTDRPIVIGLLEPLPLRATKGLPSAAPTRVEAPHAIPPLHAQVDGKRVVIEGQDEIVLQCGQASITLRRNGRVVIRGTYVETRAAGVNRIRGGSVAIN